MTKPFIISYPYPIAITDKQSAIYHIMHMCNNCDRQHDCSGAMSKRCNEIKEQIRDFAIKNFNSKKEGDDMSKQTQEQTKLYDRVVLSSSPSQNANALHGCEPVYILSAVDIQPVTMEQLKQSFEIQKILHPVWKKKTFESFLEWKAEFYETKYNIDTYDTAYFLNPNTALEYAKQNMADINEAGAYPYLVVYSRPTNHMYAEANPCMVVILKFNPENDTYEIVEDIDSKEEYQYIAAHFNNFRRPKKENIISAS